MTIQLGPELERRISERVQHGEFESAEAAVERAIDFFLDYELGEMTPGEFLATQSAVEESLAQVQRGEGISLADFDLNMRKQHGIPR